MIRRFLGAVQFLTVVPVRAATAPPGECAAFYPLVGALLGAAGGVVDWLLGHVFPRQFSALAAVGFMALLTGCLHEDGVADVADALRAHRTREKIFEILKDSRVGAFGAVALIFSIGLRWQALAAVAFHPVAALAIAGAVSRASIVALAWCGKPVSTGLAAEFRRGLRTAPAGFAILCGTLAAFGGGLIRGALLAVAAALLVVCAHVYCRRRLGGFNGDCLGAACQATELLSLMVLAWRNST